MLTLAVAPADDGARLDQWLARALRCSRREAQRLIADGAVHVDGRRGDKGTRLPAGARVRVDHAPPTDADKRPRPQPELPLIVLHVDDDVVAVDKPAGVATHPLRAGELGTLANALVARFPECAGAGDDPREGGVAHRLDADTSGVVLAARSRDAWRGLRRAFSDGVVDKEYLALVAGTPPPRGRIDAPLVQVGGRVRVAGDRDLDALAATTEYEVVARGGEVALVRAHSSSGRMHQIRAHLAHLGHPLVGDARYGGPPPAAGTRGHFLHAASIRFPHPHGAAPTTIAAPLPPDRAAALAALVGWPQRRD